MNGTILELNLSAPAYGGDCVGRLPDGRTVFVPFTIPGERVLVQLTEEKRGYARAKLIKVIHPSADRVSARCRYFQVCGGCHYQHVTYDHQLRLKQEIVTDQLRRMAGIKDPPIQQVIPSPLEWNYRNSVQFHISPGGKLGYLSSRSNDVVEIEECFLPEVFIDQIWRNVDFDVQNEIKRLSFRVGADENGMLVLEGDSPDLPEMESELPISIVHLLDGHTVVLSGSDHLTFRVSERRFRVSAGSFFQVNTIMVEKMVQHVSDLLPGRLGDLFVDLYCGVGLFSAFLAPRASRCVGIELSASACDDFAINLHEFDNVELYQGAVEQVLPVLNLRAGTVLIDPPRTGLDRKTRDAILKMEPERVVYVSCDPATLSRDLKYMLQQGYYLTQVTPFDLFPQTFHVETISLLTRR